MIAGPLDVFLEGLMPRHDTVAERMMGLVDAVARQTEVRRIKDLVEAAGRSERTLQRLFLRYVGVSPAWLQRRYRLLAAATQLSKTPPAAAQSLAYELGYADQAHFIRDFRAAIGVTPGEYVRGNR